MLGVSARWIATFCVAFEKKYTNKERAFMAFAWIPKATVQAALGGLALKEAAKISDDAAREEYEEYGNAMLTTAVFAIVITAPLGAIMINTLGTKWLEYDGDDPAILWKHGMTEPRRKPGDDGTNPKIKPFVGGTESIRIETEQELTMQHRREEQEDSVKKALQPREGEETGKTTTNGRDIAKEDTAQFRPQIAEEAPDKEVDQNKDKEE